MPKRQLPIEAELIINRLRLEANVEHQYAVIERDDETSVAEAPLETLALSNRKAIFKALGLWGLSDARSY